MFEAAVQKSVCDYIVFYLTCSLSFVLGTFKPIVTIKPPPPPPPPLPPPPPPPPLPPPSPPPPLLPLPLLLQRLPLGADASPTSSVPTSGESSAVAGVTSAEVSNKVSECGKGGKVGSRRQ
ncbi:unnamed protein product [Closterium sp. NIES-53]